MSNEVLEAVAKWRADAFRTSDIPLELAVGSLRTEHPLIEAKRTGPREWLVRGSLVWKCSVLIGICVIDH